MKKIPKSTIIEFDRQAAWSIYCTHNTDSRQFPTDLPRSVPVGLAVLVAYSPQNGLILLVIAFLISPFGLPKLGFWLLGQVQGVKYAIQDLVYG